MSWSAYLPDPVEPGEVRQALEGLSTSPEDLCDEAKEQFEAAKDAAAALVESGAVGSRPVRISLSGHGNTDHEPCAEWANDMVAVNVSQA